MSVLHDSFRTAISDLIHQRFNCVLSCPFRLQYKAHLGDFYHKCNAKNQLWMTHDG